MADASSAQEIASQILLVPASWFNSPIFIINLVIPLITTGLFYYMLLRKVHVFRSSGINLVLGYIFAFISVPFFIAQNPSAAIFVSVFGIVTLMGDRITLKWVALAFGAGIVALAITGYGAYAISLFFTT